MVINRCVIWVRPEIHKLLRARKQATGVEIQYQVEEALSDYFSKVKPLEQMNRKAHSHKRNGKRS